MTHESAEKEARQLEKQLHHATKYGSGPIPLRDMYDAARQRAWSEVMLGILQSKERFAEAYGGCPGREKSGNSLFRGAHLGNYKIALDFEAAPLRTPLRPEGISGNSRLEGNEEMIFSGKPLNVLIIDEADNFGCDAGDPDEFDTEWIGLRDVRLLCK